MPRPASVSSFVLLLTLAASAAWSQEPTTTRISDHWVFCEVTIQGQTARLKVANGELATVKVLAMNRTLGLTPVVRDAGVFVVLWDITPAAVPPGGRIRQLENLATPIGQLAQFTKTEVPLTVKLTAVKEMAASQLGTQTGPTACEIECAGIKVLAAEVIMDCDRCGNGTRSTVTSHAGRR